MGEKEIAPKTVQTNTNTIILFLSNYQDKTSYVHIHIQGLYYKHCDIFMLCCINISMAVFWIFSHVTHKSGSFLSGEKYYII